MSEEAGDNKDVETSNAEVTFNNLIIIKELGNIINLVRNEDFLETVPKSKLRRVKWVPMFDFLKQDIFDGMVQELSTMWEYENMPEKLEILEKQKEKFVDVNEDIVLWRPQLSDVKAQIKACDVVNLRKQKSLLESHAKKYEVRVNKLMKIITAKRGYLKAMQMDIQKYQKKNQDFTTTIIEKFENHDNLVKIITTDIADAEAFIGTDKGMEFE